MANSVAVYMLYHVIQFGCSYWSSARAASGLVGICGQFASDYCGRRVGLCLVTVILADSKVSYCEISLAVVTIFST
jgi:hypothetical protein